MKKAKVGIVSLALGALGFLACIPGTTANAKAIENPLLNRDTTFLVSLKGSVKNLGKEGVKASQEEYINSLRNKIGFDFRVVTTYDAINVMKIQANSSLKDVLLSGKNAEFVAINKMYRFSETFTTDAITKEEKAEGFVPYTKDNVVLENEEDEDPLGNQSSITMEIPSENRGGMGSFVAILDAGFYIEHESFSNLEGEAAAKARFHYSDLRAAQTDLIGKAKTDLGEVADSFTNDKVGEEDGSTYYNLKVPFYYDYGGNYDRSANGYNAYGYASEHGSHVASITAANGPYKGIAPNAQLALMKVFKESFPTDANPNRSSSTGANDDDITEALNDCLVLGVDALNMSLGSDLDDFRGESAAFRVLSKLEDAGCNCCISAGNGGKGLYSFMNGYNDWSTSQYDTGVLGSYATTTDTNIIASSTTPKQHYDKALKVKSKDGTEERVIGYSDQVDYSGGGDGITKENEKLLAELGSGELEFVTAGEKDSEGHYYGQASDYDKVMQAKGADYYKGKIAICDRGNTTFVDKAQSAADAGAAALIVINNDPTAYEFTFGMSWGSDGSYTIPTIPVVFVLFRDRDFLLNEALNDVTDEDGKVVAHSGKGTIIADEDADNPDKYKMSDFSSEGATSDLLLSPTISTPGSSIKGAVPGKANSKGVFNDPKPDSYAYLSGTSMAAPNYTGIISLLIGERDFENEESRVAYLKSLAMRTMSTATQYEVTSDVYSEIEAIPNQFKESDKKHEEPLTIYVPKDGTVVEETAPYSPRKQGAGIVNANKAINSPVYLEGIKPNAESGEYEVNDITGTYNTNNFAKIELLNNDLIKNGSIKLGFRVHNEASRTTTYKAKISVLTSQVSAYHNHDNEMANYVGNDATLEGAKIQTANDHVLESDVELGTFTLTGEETQDVILNAHNISDESKEYLAQFENGMFLEGYLYLEPVGEEVSAENPVLSMPYMGFYGDYGQAEAVEPFMFERIQKYDKVNGVLDGHIYGSDLVNFVGKNSYALNNIDTGSLIAGVSFDDYQTHDRKTNVSTNGENILGFAKSHPLIIDENDGEYTIHAGGSDTDVLYVQNFVNRSLTSGVVTITNKLNQTVVTSKLTDILRNTTNLFKSHITANYIGSRQLVHRAYAEIPLYSTNGVKLPNGEYTLKFTYETLYGSTQVKSYKLVIDGKAPEISYRGIFDNNGVKTLRFKFNEVYFDDKQKVSVNAGLSSFELTKVSDGYLVDIKLDEAFLDGKLFINLIDSTYNTTKFIMNEDQLNSGVALSDDLLTFGSTYTVETKELETSGNFAREYTISAFDYTGDELDLGSYVAYVTFERPISEMGNITLYGLDSEGNQLTQRIVGEAIDEYTLKVSTIYTHFVVTDGGKAQEDVVLVETANVVIAKGSLENGQVFVDKVSGKVGESVTIYVVPKDGQKVASVLVNGVEVAVNANGGYTFTLVNGTNNVVVTYSAK